MYNFAKRDGLRVTKWFVPWWLRKLYAIFEERYESKMATSSIVPDNPSDPVVRMHVSIRISLVPTKAIEFFIHIFSRFDWTAAEIDGRESLCDEKDDCPGHAGHRIANGQCIPVEIHIAGRRAPRILYADVDYDKRVDNYAGEYT